MKKLLSLSILMAPFFILSCSKDNNRKAGVCYCEFANGKKQEYDLTNLTRTQQEDACNTHDTNAANFGGDCELE